jgi:hypothetical protein
MKFHVRVLSGRLPVMKLLRDGEHTVCWQYARSNTVDDAASLSRFGVFTCS